MANVNGGVIAKAQESKAVVNNSKKTMQSLIVSMQSEIAKALPTVITPERFTRMVLTAMSTNPQLAECTPKSFLGAVMQAAQLGVEPNTPLGQAYLIPYRNKGTLEAQFQLGYKGMIDLAYRSGDVTIVQSHVVYENDEFEYELGLEPKLRHVPAKSNRGNAIYYYAMFKTKAGGYGFSVMSVDDIKEHAKKNSQAYSSSFSPWNKFFDEMAKKTVLKQTLKYAPLKSDFLKAVAADETIKTTIAPEMTDVNDETSYIDTEATETTEDGRKVDTQTGEIIDKDAEFTPDELEAK